MQTWIKKTRTYWRPSLRQWVSSITHTSLRFFNAETSLTWKIVVRCPRAWITLPLSMPVGVSCLILFQIRVDLRNLSQDITSSNSWKVFIIAITNKSAIETWSQRICCWMENLISKLQTSASLHQRWAEMAMAIWKQDLVLLIIWLLKFI